MALKIDLISGVASPSFDNSLKHDESRFVLSCQSHHKEYWPRLELRNYKSVEGKGSSVSNTLQIISYMRSKSDKIDDKLRCETSKVSSCLEWCRALSSWKISLPLRTNFSRIILVSTSKVVRSSTWSTCSLFHRIWIRFVNSDIGGR